MPPSAISSLSRAGGSWRAGRMSVAKLLVDESIDQEQHRLPKSFRLLVYLFAIDLSAFTLAFRGRADRAGDDPGSGHGGRSGHHMGPASPRSWRQERPPRPKPARACNR